MGLFCFLHALLHLFDVYFIEVYDFDWTERFLEVDPIKIKRKFFDELVGGSRSDSLFVLLAHDMLEVMLVSNLAHRTVAVPLRRLRKSCSPSLLTSISNPSFEFLELLFLPSLQSDFIRFRNKSRRIIFRVTVERGKSMGGRPRFSMKFGAERNLDVDFGLYGTAQGEEMFLAVELAVVVVCLHVGSMVWSCVI